MEAASNLIDKIIEMDKKPELMSADDVHIVLRDMQDVDIKVDRFKI